MVHINRKLDNDFKPIGSSFDHTGLSIISDRRYVLIKAYVLISVSYRAVILSKSGKASSLTMPKDAKVVKQVLNDFGGSKQLASKDWWSDIGCKLYGVAAPVADVKVLGRLDSNKSALTAKWLGADSLIVKLPLNLTMPNVLKKLRKELEPYHFAEELPAQLTPKYKLTNSKLSFPTLYKGVLALRFYMEGKPLWYIGNYLRLIPTQSFTSADAMSISPVDLAYRKEVLSIAASRLVKKAILVAENAARGRFPCDKPFPEAQLDYSSRKAGRPVGSTRVMRSYFDS
jgi:hypothetical protein